MPKLEVEGTGTFDVEEGKRLVLAIEEDAGVDILHRCGSYAKCTTCRIEYLEGEPETGEKIFIPRGTVHRLSAAGEREVRILEISFGEFDEEDIVRLEDVYGRAEP